MTRLEALERVAEAARAFCNGDGPWREVLSALDALPAPEAQGEMVEVRGHVRFNTMDPTVYVIEGGGKMDGSEHWFRNAGVFATITARVPLPRVPEIVATVEKGG